MKKNFLITGGVGFIGSNLIDRLIFYGEDINIICVDNFDTFYSEKFKQNNICLHRRMHNYKLYVEDITDYAKLRKIFQMHEITHIIHLAAKTGAGLSVQKPEDYFKTNVDGTLNLLRLATEFKVKKFIFASSSAVYGDKKNTALKEDMRIEKPLSPYAATKAAGEQICHTYSHLYGINTVCLRFFSVYGPRQRPASTIHKFCRQIAEGKPLQVFGHGKTIRDYTYIDDISQGILASIDYDKSMFEIINLGESKPININSLIDQLEINLGKKAVIEKRILQPYDVPVAYADISKAKELLGYQPSTSIKRGLKKFITWFKEFYNYCPCETEILKK